MTAKKILIALTGIIGFTAGSSQTTPKPGEVWEYRYDNRFEVFTRQYEILEVRGRYVRYRQMCTDTVKVSSIDFFKIGAVRIK